MSLARLRRSTVESGRDHPFVEALVAELRRRIDDLRSALEGQAGQETEQHNSVRMYQLGGRILELANTIRLIDTAEGADD